MAVGESSPTAGQAGDLSGAWIDRDISWLEFNRRVLHEALDERTPLLERVKFLAIFSANLDEFFMKRMSRLADPTGLAAPAQRDLAARIRAMVTSMLDEQAALLHAGAAPAAGRAGDPTGRLGRPRRAPSATRPPPCSSATSRRC